MGQRRVRVRTGDLADRFDALRAELGVVEAFPPEALAEAAAPPLTPLDQYADERHLPLVTLDPPGSRDLDQAFGIEATSQGWRVHYAIADVAAVVPPGGALDAESRQRGLTVYMPDRRVPQLPPELSEGRASLLPGEERRAALWTHELSADGTVTSTVVRRALVRSTAQLDYPTVQGWLDTGRPDPVIEALRAVGALRLEQERARGALRLPETEQEVVPAPGGGWQLAYRVPVAVEEWNAQLSLMTGLAAGEMMLEAGTGLLRTLPPPDPAAVATLERGLRSLGLWGAGTSSYQDLLAGLDPRHPREAAGIELAHALLRGAGYVGFVDGPPPGPTGHSAVGGTYAHVTAPLRRLCDRFATEVCLALCAGTPVPEWVRAALPELPALMGSAAQRAHAVERATLDLVEAAVLQSRVGEVLEAVVLSADDRGASLQVTQPAVRVRCPGLAAGPGDLVSVRVAGVDLDARRVQVEPVHAEAPEPPGGPGAGATSG